ncbi:SusC/RagA family TonB-linked outer membrane protein [Lacibacter sediminis]|uniref:SusC/RagA family TonB-linked outer membrane protein n=1 Tax=Lacibacter sediminis TaxID=2760713 RepID=A0A7G5XHD5_9BACT|nr:SusC/RagA family TonB-linked outer membrane protein [Lacibacter sediminis]QNA44888.1 SusC/RagA family TonB-linked outer membrane protein [Lacibacter sediminis]
MTLHRLLARAGALALMLMVLAMNVFAQGKTVTGKVTDSKDGTPVANASVTIKGTSRGTTTDAGGNFRIAVDNNNAVLVISSVGFTEYELTVGAQTDLTISLSAAQGTLNEVVVVGYGTQRKRDLSGSVATVSSKDFVKGALQTPEQLIAGKVAGVQITPNSGAPGSGSRIRIRGGASLNASNDPLIVIDGVPVDNGGISGATNPLNLINPNDIETFTILKDPSAAAIYGSRASNGVILITTKKGKKGKTRFNFSAQGFVQTPSGKVDVLSAQDVRDIVNAKGTPAQVALLGKESTDWQDKIFRNAFAQDFNLSATGALGNGKLPFRLSGGYLNQDGILKTGNFQRLTGALNLNPSFFNNKLKVDLNLKGSRTTNFFANEGAIGNAITFDPTKPVNSSSKRYGGYWEWTDADGLPTQLSNRNPVGLLYNRDNTSEVYRSIGNIQFDYQLPFVKGLRANLNLGYDVSKGSGTNIVSDSAADTYRRKGNYNPYHQERTNKLMDFYFNYTSNIRAINSRVDFTAGTGYQDFEFYSYNFPDRRFNGSIVPESEPNFISQAPGYTLISYYGRLVYSLANKYTVTLNARTDGTSKFNKANRWGFFPSAAVAWQINEEEFLKNSKVVSNLKLRAGYGVTGQQDGIPFYAYIPVYGLSNNQAQYQLGNSFINLLRPSAYDVDLRWETTTNINAAIDFGFIDNRINGTVEGFIRKTEDLLSTVPISAGSNFTNQLFTNVGNIESKGLELTLNAVPVRSKNIEWEIGANFTYVVPKITNLLVNPDPNFTGVAVGGISGGTGNTIQRHIVGERPASFYVYKQVYDASSKPIEGLYEDLNRDGIINEKDLYIYQSPEAKYFLGITSNVTVNRFSAGFVMRGSIGNYMYDNLNSNNGVYRQVVNPLGFLANGTKDYLHTGFVNNQYFSDYYIKNASFLRMDNINFGYDAGEIAKNVRLRITANIQNVFVISKYGGLDPEIAGGIDNTIYPRPRTYVLGFNFDF